MKNFVLFSIVVLLSYLVSQSFLANDVNRAIEELKKIANQGDVEAQKYLAGMYRNGGQGLPQNYVKAHMYYSLAAASGDSEAAGKRGIVERKMTPEQIAEAEKLASEWKPGN